MVDKDIEIDEEIEFVEAEAEALIEEPDVEVVEAPEDTLESLNIYMRQLNRMPVLSKDEELQLAKTIKKNKEYLLSLCIRDTELLKSLLSLEEAKISKLKKVYEDILPLEPTIKAIKELNVKFINSLKYNLARKTVKGVLLTNFPKLKISHQAIYKSIKVVEEKAKPTQLTKIQQAKKDLEQAKKRLTECNLKLVFSRAKRFLNRGLTIEDLLQEGNLGLMKAVERFDFRRNLKFSTYATWWIEQAFGRSLADKSRLIRVPVHMVESINKMSVLKKEHGSKTGKAMENSELAKKMKQPTKKIEQIAEIMDVTQVPLDATINESGTTLSDLLVDERAEDAFEEIEQRELHDLIRNTLGSLEPKYEKILRMRFGIGERSPKTLEEIGESLQLSKERIRQMQNKALSKLKKTRQAEAIRETFRLVKE